MSLEIPESIPSLRDFMVFEAHVKNARARRGAAVPKEWYEAPTFYYANPFNMYRDGEDVPKPAYTNKLDFELELACVIGVGGRDIAVEDAEAHILGFTVLNDWSARDVQRQEMAVGLGPSKAKDFAFSLGPAIVTLDELAEHRIEAGRYDLGMTASVNGVEISRGNARDMNWNFCELIAHASSGCELRSGEVLGSGTVGTGCILELGPEVHRWLEVGDEVVLAIDVLGALTNCISDPQM